MGVDMKHYSDAAAETFLVLNRSEFEAATDVGLRSQSVTGDSVWNFPEEPRT